MAAVVPLYAVAIKNAAASKDPKTMKSVATQAKKQIGELQTALKTLESAIEKLGKK
jgi:Domain of unknown function (DUF1843)